MKKVIAITTVMSALLVSCGSDEWTDKDKEDFIKACEDASMGDCDCALDLTMKKYPKVSEFNKDAGGDTELQKAILKECEGIDIE